MSSVKECYNIVKCGEGFGFQLVGANGNVLLNSYYLYKTEEEAVEAVKNFVECDCEVAFEDRTSAEYTVEDFPKVIFSEGSGSYMVELHKNETYVLAQSCVYPSAYKAFKDLEEIIKLAKVSSVEKTLEEVSIEHFESEAVAPESSDNVKIVEVPVDRIVEVPVEKIVEVPVERVVERIVEKIVEVPAGQTLKPKAASKTLEELIAELSDEQKGYFDTIKAHTEKLDGVKVKATKTAINYMLGKTKLFTLRCPKGVTEIVVVLQDHNFMRETNTEDVTIKATATTIKVINGGYLNAALSAIDFKYEALTEED